MAHFKLIILALVVQTATTVRTAVTKVVGSHGEITPHLTTSNAEPPSVISQRELKKRIFLGGDGGHDGGRYLWLFKGGTEQAFWPIEAGGLVNDGDGSMTCKHHPAWLPPLGEWDSSPYDPKEFEAGAFVAIQRKGGMLETYPLPIFNFEYQFKMVGSKPDEAAKLVPGADIKDLEKIVFARKVLPNQAYLEEDLHLPGQGKALSIDQPREWGAGQQTKTDPESEFSYVYVFPERSKWGSEVYFSQVEHDGKSANFNCNSTSGRVLPPGYDICPEKELKEIEPEEFKLFEEGEQMTVRYIPCSPESMPHMWRGLQGSKLEELQEIWREACGEIQYPHFEHGF